MIGRLEGVLREKRPTQVVVDVGGVGYELAIPLSTFAALPDEGKVVALRVHTHVREDALLLYGFARALEREAFELLLHANRVGPKLALTALSGIEAEELVRAIQDGDVAVLQGVPGIGRRMAERIVVELRERAGEIKARAAARAGEGARAARPASAEEALVEQVLSALGNLGVAKPQAERAARQALEDLGAGAPVEGLIRAALRGLSR
jgi:Holliday junction DNA helicase RuvA